MINSPMTIYIRRLAEIVNPRMPSRIVQFDRARRSRDSSLPLAIIPPTVFVLVMSALYTMTKPKVT